MNFLSLSKRSMETAVFFPIPILPLFFSMFSIIYLMAYFFVFRTWSSNIRPEASSCFMSLFHGTPAVFLATFAISSDQNRGFSSSNTKTQNLALDYSIAYFLTDLLHYIIFFPSDILFIGHHLATLFVFITCRHLVFHGAYTILSLLILGEVTSFCQNVWTLATARRYDDELSAKVYASLSPYFYAFYSIVRGIFGPFFVYQMGVFYISGKADNVIPRWLWISWMFVVVTAIGVSILWISNLWIELFKEKKAKLEKKL